MPLSRKHSSSVRSAYTLVEVLIVMGIIVLAIALAIPAIRSLTGAKSQQGAQNTIAAYLARARTDAIGLQQITGVLLYVDKSDDRVKLTEVVETPTETGDASGVLYLAIAADKDPLLLPPGIRVRTVMDTKPPAPPGAAFAYVDAFPRPNNSAHMAYLGFNSNQNPGYQINTGTTWDKAALGGVILFDGHGRLVTRQYGFRFVSQGAITPLQSLVTSSPVTTANNWPQPAPTLSYLRSQIMIAIFDRESFLTQSPSGQRFTEDNVPSQEKVTVAGVDVGTYAWLDANATLILVNRFNGTLTRAE